jgi:hypothetical protein
MTAPIDQFPSFQAINLHLKSKVLFQEPAINGITETLMRVSLGIRPGKERIHTLTLGGSADTGKSETLSQVRHLLGMEAGYPNAHRSIRFSSREFLQGHRDQMNLIVDRIIHPLREAISHICGEFNGGFFRKPLILLEIDHIEEFSGSSLQTVLEGLQDHGALTASDGTRFQLPGNYDLLLIMTYTCDMTQ